MSKVVQPNEIHLSRLYDAPVAVVWDAWTDPDKVGKWWGPRGFTLTTHSKDLRNGGRWIYTMHGPDGVDYPNDTFYHEVEEQKKLVYDHGANDNQGPLFRVSVTFAEVNGKTQMEMTMTLPTPEAAEETKKFIKKAGGNSTWDRLGEFLEKQNSNNEIFIINRSFNAPVDTMFDMWTDADHFAKWLPPVGLSMSFIKHDIRKDGVCLYSMSDGADFTMYGRIQYLEIVRPGLIVYTQQFTDKDGNISRYPGDPAWPETMKTTVEIIAESDSSCRVVVLWEISEDATATEIEAFVNERAGMTNGWSGSFDKLETLLVS